MDEAWAPRVTAAYHAGLGYAALRPRRTPAGLIGEQLGSGVGSVEFLDYREYTPGDDLRRVDWSVYARSDGSWSSSTAKRSRPHRHPHRCLARWRLVRLRQTHRRGSGLAAAALPDKGARLVARRLYTHSANTTAAYPRQRWRFVGLAVAQV
ncbi:MAG: DUF58 domain-containing protein [Phycisphaerales bacterium]